MFFLYAFYFYLVTGILNISYIFRDKIFYCIKCKLIILNYLILFLLSTVAIYKNQHYTYLINFIYIIYKKITKKYALCTKAT